MDGVTVGGAPPRWFLGIPFTPLPLTEAVSRIAARPAAAPFVYVTTPNAQHAAHVDQGDRHFIAAHDGAWLVLNDSRVLRLLSRRLFGEDLPVAAGSDLTLELLRHHVHPDDAVTVIGGSDEVEARLRAQFGLRRLARFTPPMGFYRHPAEIDRCVDFILAYPAHWVFLVVGVPQSETVARWVVERGGAVGVGLCVGSSLSFATGVTRRAPAVFRRANLEWLHRLLTDPRRLARRYFVESAPVLWIAARTRMTPASRRSHARRGAG